MVLKDSMAKQVSLGKYFMKKQFNYKNSSRLWNTIYGSKGLHGMAGLSRERGKYFMKKQI
jgi:hypothetical protein